MEQLITFVIFCFNEEQRIESCLKNFYGWGKILVIDNCSTDQSVAIARKYADKVVTRKNIGHSDNEEAYQYIWANVDTPWIYRAYAGEALPGRLLKRLTRASLRRDISVVRIAKRTISYGVETRNWASGYHPRMIRQEGLTYKGCIIHQNGVITAQKHQILTLEKDKDLCIWHFRDYTARKTEEVFSAYLDRDAIETYEVRRRRFSGSRLVLGTVYFMVVPYLRNRAFMRGWPAVFNAFWIGVYEFNRQVRLWEREKGWTLEEVRRRHMKMRMEILASAAGHTSKLSHTDSERITR